MIAVVVNNNNYNIAIPADHMVKLKETEKKDKDLDLTRELKKTMGHKSNGVTNCN